MSGTITKACFRAEILPSPAGSANEARPGRRDAAGSRHSDALALRSPAQLGYDALDVAHPDAQLPCDLAYPDAFPSQPDDGLLLFQVIVARPAKSLALRLCARKTRTDPLADHRAFELGKHA